MRIKVSDGDMVIVKLGSNATQSQVAHTRTVFEMWTKERGLQGVTIITVSTSEDVGFDVIVLSVNDLFQEQVINGKSP